MTFLITVTRYSGLSGRTGSSPYCAENGRPTCIAYRPISSNSNHMQTRASAELDQTGLG
jgi:hypothetical protein